ncbi:MAG: pitrilysin family protein, partial [Acidobacteriota bacterium]
MAKRNRQRGPAAVAAMILVCVATLPASRPKLRTAAGTISAEKRSLNNGLTILLDKDDSAPTTVLCLLIRGGKRAEPSLKQGLAFLTTRLAIEIPDSDKVQELMKLATRFSVTCRGDYSSIGIECLSANLEASLKIFSQILRDPLFSGLRIDAVKKYMEHQSRIEEDDSVTIGHLANLRAFFGNPGYQGSIYGDRASLGAIKNKDVSEYYQRFFSASQMIISISSDLSSDIVVDLLGKYLGGISRGTPAALETAVRREISEKNSFLERDTQQTFLSLAYPLPPVSPRRYALAVLLENLLGKGPGSRLWPLRTEMRLAYNVSCRTTQMMEGGVVEAYLETENAKLSFAREALQKALTDLFAAGVDEIELQDAKAIARAGFWRENEAKASKTATRGSFEALGLGHDYARRLFTEMDAVTPEEMNSYIREVLAPE